MPAFLIAWIAKSALMQSPVGAFIKAVPAWAWKAAGIIAALVGAFLVHQHYAHKAIANAYAQGKADEAKHVEQQALKIKAKVDALTGKIAAQERMKNDEQNRRIAAAADDLRLRGPGKATCAGSASLPSAAGGHVAPSGDGNAAGPQVPSDDRAAVPWGWLVNRAEEHDVDRAEVLSWREWYSRLVAAWPKPAEKH
jgi:hypothetical protein